jgi:hypothetical protein
VLLASAADGKSAIVLSAGHVWMRGLDEVGAVAPDLSSAAAGELTLLQASGKEGSKGRAATNLFHPGLPEAETRPDNWKNLSPRHDFWFLTIPIQSTDKALAKLPGFRAVKAGEKVRVVGIAGGGEGGPRITACTVLDDAAARAAVARLAKEGDSEGGIPYDGEAEAICEGKGYGGMSGGGVFAEDGKVVGTTIRASDIESGRERPIVRFARASFAVKQLHAALDRASTEDRERIERILPADLRDEAR